MKTKSNCQNEKSINVCDRGISPADYYQGPGRVFPGLKLISIFAVFCSLGVNNTAFAQSPGGIGTANLALWLNPAAYSGSVWTNSGTAASAPTLSVPAGKAAPALVAGDPLSNYNPYVNFASIGQALKAAGITGSQFVDGSNNYSLFTVINKNMPSPTSTGASGNMYSHFLKFNEVTANGHSFGIGYNTTLSANGVTGSSNTLCLHYINSPFGFFSYNINSGYADFPDNKPVLTYVNMITGSGANKTITLGANGRNYVRTNQAATNALMTLNGNLTIGGSGNDPFQAYEMINKTQEILMYKSPLAGNDLTKVNSYLAIKYGLTLRDGAALGTPYQYMNSAGTVTWATAHGTDDGTDFNWNMAGVARDDNGALNQKQGHSVNPGNQIVITTASAVQVTNAAVATAISANLQSLIWGDNNLSTTLSSGTQSFTYSGSPSNVRMTRIWKVQNNGITQNMLFSMPQAGVGTAALPAGPCAKYVLVTANDAAFTTNVQVTPIYLAGTNYEAKLQPPPGVFYFTYGKMQSLQATITPATSTIYEGDTLTYQSNISPASSGAWASSGNAVASVSSTGFVTGLSNGTTSITYTDTLGCSVSFILTVIGTPKAVKDSATVVQNGTLSGNTATNDTCSAGTCTYSTATPPAHGNLTMNANGTYTYTPNPGYIGTDSFSYSLCDNATPVNHCDTATIFITVSLPLAVKYINFEAYQQNKTTILQWNTATEVNNKGFNIERSPDANTWESIGFINAKSQNGNSSTPVAYSFTDHKPLPATNYYRLKQTDFDGKSGYSEVRMAVFRSVARPEVLPNPVLNMLQIQGLTGKSNIRIMNTIGQVLIEVTADNGTRQIIDVATLAKGIYFVYVRDEQGKADIYKIVKE